MSKIVIIGGGAAGFFAAIRNKELYPDNEVVILEKNNKLLSKVKISGGGRCNVTHACFNPQELVKFYPRGAKELLSPFHQFNPTQTVEWFEARGVKLKVESDNRMFPESNDSQTIVDCLLQSAQRAGVQIRLNQNVKNILAFSENQWKIETTTHTFVADKIFVAAGSSPSMWNLLEKLGHKIISPLPSLFTFNIEDERVQDLAGVSVEKVVASVEGTKLKEEGAFLITHWGVSAPVILRLSAWGARILAEKKYEFHLIINFLATQNAEQAKAELQLQKADFPKRQISAHTFFQLPMRLWKKLVAAAQIPETLIWADISKKQLQNLAEQLTQARFQVKGKSTFKEEFVTCGGVSRKEIDFKTMESKMAKGIFFGGEIIDIDAITGGFNFQAAWTCAWIAGGNMGN